jgi:cytochrome P450
VQYELSIKPGEVQAWLSHPDQTRYFLDNPDKGLDCISEMLRFVSMSSVQTRIAVQDFEFGGKTIRAGDLIYLMIVGANRDPAIFPEPKKFDCTRKIDRSMVFAPGFHHCIGSLLARTELDMFFRHLLTRYEHIRILDGNRHFKRGTPFADWKSYKYHYVVSRARRRRPVIPYGSAGALS